MVHGNHHPHITRRPCRIEQQKLIHTCSQPTFSPAHFLTFPPALSQTVGLPNAPLPDFARCIALNYFRSPHPPSHRNAVRRGNIVRPWLRISFLRPPSTAGGKDFNVRPHFQALGVSLCGARLSQPQRELITESLITGDFVPLRDLRVKNVPLRK